MLAAAFLFNLGQGVLRPSLPLYLQQFFGANYRMVTLIPVVFGAGKWAASLPTGYLLDRLGGRRLMVTGLFVIAACDIASVMAPVYSTFLGVRGVAGMGWAMFGVVATTTMVDRGAGRGRAISLLLMSETLGLLLGSVVGGWIYQRVAMASPFVFEAACMLVAAAVVGWRTATPEPRAEPVAVTRDRRLLRGVVRTPGVLLASLTNAALTAVQTGVLVFLFPLYLAEQGGLRPETVGYVVGLGVLGRLGALWLAGRVSDHRDRLRMLGLGLLGYGVLLGSLAFVTDPLLLGLWSFMIGGGAGFVAGLPTAIIGDRVAAPLHGIAIGWLRTVTDAGMLLGPVLMGAFADAVHLTTPFLFAAVLMCVLAGCCRRHAVRA
ncbi:MAG: MFS transporter [Candidatus Rokuibacteriota bacterium]